MYKEFKALDLATIDKEILDFWQKESIFQKSIDQKDANNRITHLIPLMLVLQLRLKNSAIITL